MKIYTKVILLFVIVFLLLFGAFFIFFSPDQILDFIFDQTLLFLIVTGVYFLISISLIILLSLHISRPLRKINDVIRSINKEGTETVKAKLPVRNDEIGNLSKSVDNLNTTFRITSNFAYLLVRGKYDVDQEIEDDNFLGNVLFELKEKLQISEKEKKYVQDENSKTEWYQQGISNFTILLQQNFKTTVEMANSAVRELVKHTEVEQGGIFILEKKEDKDILVLDSAYAYDKKKLLNTEIEVGESLVGKCAQERKMIQIDDLPEGYTFIGSGLGEGTPESLLLLPMIYENNLFGVIEIASLKKIPEYKINFLQTISERIASEISNIQSKLLSEKLADDFKLQAEEISEKEKESAKMISDLQQKNEELLLALNSKEEIINRLENFISVVEFNEDGEILYYNKYATEQYQSNENDEPELELILKYDNEPADFNVFWETVKEKGKLRKTISIETNDGIKTIHQYFVFLSSEGISKIVCTGMELDN